jgi:hypothetical protein
MNLHQEVKRSEANKSIRPLRKFGLESWEPNTKPGWRLKQPIHSQFVWGGIFAE